MCVDAGGEGGGGVASSAQWHSVCRSISYYQPDQARPSTNGRMDEPHDHGIVSSAVLHSAV